MRAKPHQKDAKFVSIANEGGGIDGLWALDEDGNVWRCENGKGLEPSEWRPLPTIRVLEDPDGQNAGSARAGAQKGIAKR
jgi:hypothetical protein